MRLIRFYDHVFFFLPLIHQQPSSSGIQQRNLILEWLSWVTGDSHQALKTIHTLFCVCKDTLNLTLEKVCMQAYQ